MIDTLTTAFALGRALGPMDFAARGAMGEVWRLRTVRGDFAVKKLFDWARDDRFELEVQVTERAIAAGIETPDVVRATTGDVAHSIDGARWRVFGWRDLGEAYAPPLDPARAERLGEVLARLHGLGLKGEAAQIIPWFTARRDVAAWRWMEGQARAAKAPFAEALTAALPGIIDLVGTAPPEGFMGPCVLCHCDLNAGNIWSGRGGLALIDWEHAGAIPPLWELGAALTTWAIGPDGSVDNAAAEALARGYGAVDGLDVGIFAGAISAHLNWTLNRAHAALTHKDAEERGRAAAEARKLFDAPLNVRQLNLLLDALQAVLHPGRRGRTIGG